MLKNEIDILIPFRGSTNTRIINLFYIINYYKKFIPSANIILIEQTPTSDITLIKNLIHKHIIINLNEKLFCKSYLFNEGYNNSFSKYLILADADCFPDKNLLINFNSLNTLIEQKYIIPHDKVHYLSSIQSDFIKSNFIKNNIITDKLNINELEKDNEYYCWGFPVGGMSIVSNENFYKINGFDTNFIGWGGEDDNIYNRFLNSDIGAIRLKNNLYHLRHEWNLEHSKYSNEELEEKKKNLPKIKLIKHE